MQEEDLFDYEFEEYRVAFEDEDDDDFGRAFYEDEDEEDDLSILLCDDEDDFDDFEDEPLWGEGPRKNVYRPNYAKQMRDGAMQTTRHQVDKRPSASPYMYGKRLADLAREDAAKRKAQENLAKARATGELVYSIQNTIDRFKDRIQANSLESSYVGYTSALSQPTLRIVRRGSVPRFELGRLLIVIGGAGSVATAAHSILVGSFLGVAEPLLLTGLGGLSAPLLISGALQVRNLKAHSRPKTELRKAAIIAECALLRAWLSEHYSLEVSEATLNDMVQAVHVRWWRLEFSASGGGGYTFSKVSDEKGWLVSKDGMLLPQRTSLKPSAPVAEPKAVFTGELEMLHKRIEQLQELLGKQPLSSEQEHVLNRVREDVAATASTLSALADLDSLDAGQAKAARVLVLVVEELDELVTEKRAQLLGALEAQRIYVGERRPSPSRLTLAKSNKNASERDDAEEK